MVHTFQLKQVTRLKSFAPSGTRLVNAPTIFSPVMKVIVRRFLFLLIWTSTVLAFMTSVQDE